MFGANDVLAMTIATGVVFAASLALFMLMERASIGFGRLQPEIATVYDPAFWRIERHWKLSDNMLATAFAGTPMRNFIQRLLGVKMGRRVFDDGAILSERTLVEIGDEANLNEHVLVQAHSLEEGVFKSDHVKIGARASVGVAALVHYGVTLGEDCHLDPDAFLMKGEVMPAGSRWRGNPAKMVASRRLPARVTDGRRDDLDLASLQAALAPHGALVAARRIRPGDEAAFASRRSAAGDFARRRASGAARLAARRILRELESDPSAPLPRSSFRRAGLARRGRSGRWRMTRPSRSPRSRGAAR